MTDIKNDDFTLIHSIEDVIPLYKGNNLPLPQQRIGFETEICLYKKDKQGNPIAATSQECSKLLKLVESRGHQPQLEMASALEYASPAFRVTEAGALTHEIVGSFKAYLKAIEDSGLKASDASLAPFITLESAGQNLVDRDRARGLVKGMALFKAPEFLKVTLLCTSTQVSLSYKDPDDLYDLLSTAYALQPVIYGLFANYPAFIEGKDEKIDFNPRAKFYEAFGKDGGIPDSFLKAQNGDEFIKNHAKQVFETEMLFYKDRQDNLIWPEKPVKFKDLADIGLNTRSNYDLAETFIYSDLKVCNIRDENGKPTGKRVEVRGFDAGAFGVETAVPFIQAVLRDEETNARVKGLLLEYGIAPDLPDFAEKIKAGREAVAHHGSHFLDVTFGNGNLKDFCKDLGDILQAHAARNPGVAPYIKKITDICASGTPIAEQKAKATPDYNSAVKSLFPEDPNSSQRNLKHQFGM